MIYNLIVPPNEGLYKMDWMCSPLPTQPEYHLYYLFFKTEEDARLAAIILKLSYDHPDYRIYKVNDI